MSELSKWHRRGTNAADVNGGSEPKRLTIFSSPKPFRGHVKIIQTNAIQSWVLLPSVGEVILFGAEEGTAEVAEQFGIRYIADVECNEYGTPLVSSIFKMAQDIASQQIMCYVNADIILTSGFITTIQRIPWQTFLTVGQRWDIDVAEPMDFSSPDWEKELQARVLKAGKLHSPVGIDYFVFPRGLYLDIPPFAIGRPGWDNWMIYRARSLKIPVIDATKVIMAIHQNHDYSHHPEGIAGVCEGLEAQRNRKFAGGYNRVFDIRDATLALTSKGIKKRSPVRINYRHFGRSAGALFKSTMAALRGQR